MLVEVLCGLVQVLKVFVEALSANSSSQIVVEDVKEHDETLGMEITA